MYCVDGYGDLPEQLLELGLNLVCKICDDAVARVAHICAWLRKVAAG